MMWRSSNGGSNKDLIITGIKGLDWCSGRIPVFYTQGSGMIPPSPQSQVALLQSKASDPRWRDKPKWFFLKQCNPQISSIFTVGCSQAQARAVYTLDSLPVNHRATYRETKLFTLTLIPIGNWPELRSACFWTMECQKKTHGHTGRTGEVWERWSSCWPHLQYHCVSH